MKEKGIGATPRIITETEVKRIPSQTYRQLNLHRRRCSDSTPAGPLGHSLEQQDHETFWQKDPNWIQMEGAKRALEKHRPCPSCGSIEGITG